MPSELSAALRASTIGLKAQDVSCFPILLIETIETDNNNVLHSNLATKVHAEIFHQCGSYYSFIFSFPHNLMEQQPHHYQRKIRCRTNTSFQAQ